MTQITRWLSAVLVSTLLGAPLALAQEPPAPPEEAQPEPPLAEPAPPAEPTEQDEPPAAMAPSPMAASDAYQRGLTAYRNRNFSQALQEFGTVLQAEPDRADVYYLMGYSHYMLKHFQDSLDAFRLAFELDPELDPRGIYQARYRTGSS
ncbi:MAG TPA: tetratricopeptide repeat protein [Vicinamibacteria bacterium]